MDKHTPDPDTVHEQEPTPVPPETAREPAAPKKRLRSVVLILLPTLLVVLLAAAGWFFWQTSHIRGNMFANAASLPTPIPTATPAATPALKGGEPLVQADWIDSEGNAWNYRDDLVTVLLMGVDYMGDESHWFGDMTFNSGNADVLALAVLNTTDNTLSLLHIPRDTMAEVLVLDADGNYLDMVTRSIATAYSFGDGAELSCELTVDAVSRLLYGVPIQRYGAVSYDILDKLNDLVGGVTLTLEEDFTVIDPAFTAGSTVTLTGDQLRQFITYRDTTQLSSAYDRGQRHMLLLNVLYDQCKAAFQEDITFPVQMYNRASDHITTNLNVVEISYLARQIFGADFSTDSVITLRGEMTMGEEYAEYIPDPEWLRNYVADTFCVPAE